MLRDDGHPGRGPSPDPVQPLVGRRERVRRLLELLGSREVLAVVEQRDPVTGHLRRRHAARRRRRPPRPPPPSTARTARTTATVTDPITAQRRTSPRRRRTPDTSTIVAADDRQQRREPEKPADLGADRDVQTDRRDRRTRHREIPLSSTDPCRGAHGDDADDREDERARDRCGEHREHHQRPPAGGRARPGHDADRREHEHDILESGTRRFGRPQRRHDSGQHGDGDHDPIVDSMSSRRRHRRRRVVPPPPTHRHTDGEHTSAMRRGDHENDQVSSWPCPPRWIRTRAAMSPAMPASSARPSRAAWRPPGSRTS